ncbi:MAG: hypothetical protein E7622_02855 [Ruminococcaceae bacterium]|nr:hypothetical protein [Oscillospiraceae bacterium]
MRNKTFLILALTLLLACVFAFCVSAEEESTAPVIPEWSEVQIIDSISPKEGFDTTSRVMLKNSDNSYTVYPAYYILKCTDTTFHNLSTSNKEFDFSALNAAIADTTGESYSYASIVRLEIPSGFVTIQDRIFRKDKGFTALMTLKVPEGVTSMGTYNFYQSESILEVELPNSLKNITTNLFAEAVSLKKVVMNGAVSIGASAFSKCSALETVEWGEDVLETIGDNAFDYCAAFTGKIVANSLTSIGKCAFRGTGVTEVEFDGGFTTVGSDVFYNCDSLVKLTFDGNAGVNMCKGCDNLTTVVFGENTRIVDEYAFVDCPKIDSLTLHDNITTIGRSAFLRAYALTSLSLPESLTSIGVYAFSASGVSGTIVIPETLTTVGENVFNGCANLQKVIVKNKIISPSMFINCSKLSTLVLHKDIESIGKDSLSGVVNGTFLTIYTGNDPERLKTLNGISRFNTKYIYSYEQYLLDIENGVTYNQNTIIYGADYCIELNGGEHTINDTPTCVLPSGCIKCDRMPGEPALGHDKDELIKVVYITFDQKGDKTYTCTRCEDEVLEEKSANPIFTAEGYACNPAMTSLTGGFTVDWNAYNDYISAGGSALRFGLIAVNSQKFAEGDELLTDGILSTTYGFQVEMTSTKYSVFSCSINNFSAEAKEKLNLIIALYIIDSEGNISYIQSDSDYVNNSTIGTKTFDTVTLSLVAANAPSNSVMALINKEDE